MYIHSEVIKICNLNEGKRKNNWDLFSLLKKNKTVLNYKDGSGENIYLTKCTSKEIKNIFFYYFWKVMIYLLYWLLYFQDSKCKLSSALYKISPSVNHKDFSYK